MDNFRNVFIPENKVLVEIAPKEEKVGGFYMPETHRAENQQCSVIKVADNIKAQMDISVVPTCGITVCDAGIEVDLTPIHPYYAERKEAGYVYKVVDIKDILIIY